MKKTLQVLYFNLALFCVLLVGLETVGQIGFYVLKGYPVYRSPEHRDSRLRWHYRLFERHPYLVGRLQSSVRVEADGKTVTTTPEHTRSTGAPPVTETTVKIAVVGGSTTFGAGVTDAETWPARLQQRLGSGYAVINYGLLGYSSAEAVVQMGLVIPESRPDIVVFYEGWNDIRSYHEAHPGADSYSHGMRQFSTLGIELPEDEPVLVRLANMSAICRLAVTLAKWTRAEPPVQDSAAAPTFSTPDSFVDRIYLRNLKTLKTLAAQNGAFAIFVPQVMNQAWFPAHPGAEWWTPHIDNRAMPELMGRFDALMSQACRAAEPGCIVLSQILDHPWTGADFLDAGHFSASGGEAFARQLEGPIREQAARLTPRGTGRPGGR